MRKVEILAPAGSYDTMKAALNSGADAVYLGGQTFGARAYADNLSQSELIDAIRKRQHEFNNHLQAILCMHYTIHTYSELIEAQLSYCNSIVDNNKFYRLLRGEWPVLSGFLYGKLQEADSKGIRIRYQYRVKKKNDRIPEFVFVEILGILLDNAVEAVVKIPDPVIRLYVLCKDFIYVKKCGLSPVFTRN